MGQGAGLTGLQLLGTSRQPIRVEQIEVREGEEEEEEEEDVGKEVEEEINNLLLLRHFLKTTGLDLLRGT